MKRYDRRRFPAPGIESEIPQGYRSKHEELERKARFFAEQKRRPKTLSGVMRFFAAVVILWLPRRRTVLRLHITRPKR
jgi:hypothetical protein